MECTTAPEICALAKDFMQAEIRKHYYTDGYPLPDCPAPSNTEEWEQLAKQTPSKLPCGEFATGQATCVLGRFQLNSLVVDTDLNQTTFGTVLGCANKQLLESVKATTLGKDRRVISSLHTVVGCHSDYSQSDTRDSLKHFLQLEHCSQISDMCYTDNYCIHPRFTDVRTFKRNGYSEPYEGRGVAFFTILIWVAVVIGLIVVAMTFAGIKYS